MKKDYFLCLTLLFCISIGYSQNIVATSNSTLINTDNKDVNSIIWDQLQGSGTNGIVSDYFTGIPGGTYSADDFQLTTDTRIEIITSFGFQNNMTLETLITGFDVYIYTDNGGAPSSDPSFPATGVFELINFDPLNSALTISADGLGGYSFALDVSAANGSDVILGAGIYWLVVAPRMNLSDADAANRWNWYEAFGVSNLSEGMIIDPDGIFGGLPWTAFSGLGTGFESLAFTIEGDDILSIDEINLSKVTIVPNPVKNRINIQLHPSNGLVKVELFNIIGQTVYKGQKTHFDISELNSGIYILKLTTDKGELTKRIIKD